MRNNEAKWVIENLDRPGHYWRGSVQGHALAPAGWAAERDGDYKRYLHYSVANRIAVRLQKQGRFVSVTVDPVIANRQS